MTPPRRCPWLLVEERPARRRRVELRRGGWVLPRDAIALAGLVLLGRCTRDRGHTGAHTPPGGGGR